jgi:putative hydrolase of the HAD superfamily
MVMANALRTVVFDLDDTLYSEADYVQSGKQALEELIEKVHQLKVDPRLYDQKDFIGAICDELSLHSSVRSSLLWYYRLHTPRIVLRPGAADLIAALRVRGDQIAIITDGRSVTQRLKIRALDLQVDHICISEEVGSEKPDPTAFIKVECACPASSFVYVADNCAKDFVAPRQRKWLSIGLRPDQRSIHGRFDQADAVMPDLWADDFDQISKLLGINK